MRVLFLGNNWVGWQVARWLEEQGEEIVGLVIHPPQKRRYGEEIIDSVKVDQTSIFDGAKLRQTQTLDAIKELQPDIGVSAFFGYILHPECLGLMPAGCVNIHPALLPYNRGAYPNVWSIVEGTPVGATLHYMDAGVDTGDITAQRQVPVEPTDTGGSLYHKSEQLCVDLFKENWHQVRSGQAPRIQQRDMPGTYHRTRDVDRIDEIQIDRTYTARELIDVIRARTFPPYAGAYFLHEGRKVHLRLQLLYEDQLGETTDGTLHRD